MEYIISYNMKGMCTNKLVYNHTCQENYADCACCLKNTNDILSKVNEIFKFRVIFLGQ